MQLISQQYWTRSDGRKDGEGESFHFFFLAWNVLRVIAGFAFMCATRDREGDSGLRHSDYRMAASHVPGGGHLS